MSRKKSGILAVLFVMGMLVQVGAQDFTFGSEAAAMVEAMKDRQAREAEPGSFKARFAAFPSPTNYVDISIPVAAGTNSNATTPGVPISGSGIFGGQVEHKDLVFFSVLINISSSSSTYSGLSMGTFLLDPTTSGSSLSVNFCYLPFGAYLAKDENHVSILPVRGGGFFKLLGGTGNWKAGSQSFGVQEGILKIGLQGQFGGIPLLSGNDSNPNWLTFMVQGGWAGHLMAGDAAQEPQASFRSADIGVSDTEFSEWFVAVYAGINGVSGYVKLSYVGTRSPVLGFSGTQITWGLTTQTKFYDYQIKLQD